MSAVGAVPARPGWGLWRRQALVVAGLEFRKTFLRPRTFPVYLLAVIPVAFSAMFALVIALEGGHGEADHAQLLTVTFAGVFSLIQRFSIFFSCVWLFVNLFRGEMIDRTLHFPFLAPVRREVLLVGKFVAGLVLVSAVYAVTTVICFGVLHLPFAGGAGASDLIGGSGRQLASYVLVAVLGCVGYGAVFLLIGLFFRNPIVPALVIWLYELVNYLLPPLLKKISVIHYLESLRPFQIGEGSIAVVGQPTSPLVSIPGIVAVTLALLALAAWRLRRLEIDYSGD